MKILIVDRDEMATQLLKSKLEPLGHKIFIETVKNDAMDLLKHETYDIIFLDPSPLTSARPLLLNIRRAVNNYPYIFLTTENCTEEEAIKSGANACFAKPFDMDSLAPKLTSASRLIQLVNRIGDDSEDFPSAGGVIAKSAFNQLFLSAIDRADRYGEKTFILFFTMSNYDEIRQLDGPYVAEYAVAKLSQYLVRLRRQSDIIGQTAKYEFALLLQRPVYETEPIEAANRFAEALGKYELNMNESNIPLELRVSLVDLPTSNMVVEHIISYEKTSTS